MSGLNTEELTKARHSAFRFLKIRPQSVEEIRQKLLRKKISPETVSQTIEYLLKAKLLDDRLFTQSWIRWRLQRSLGLNRIAFELKTKGIDKEIIQEELFQTRQSYSENEAAYALAQRQKLKYKNLDPDKKKKRLFDFLARRGYSLETIKESLKRVRELKELKS